MASPLLILFGLVAPPDAPAWVERTLAEREQAVVRAFAGRGFQVRLPAEGQARPPTGAVDVAARLGAARVVVLDYDPVDDAVWVVHHLRGLREPWDVRQVECRRAGGLPFDCPALEIEALVGLRPRTDLDVDVSAALRGISGALTRCLRGRTGPARLEVDLRLNPADGAAAVDALAPARAAESSLGRCVRDAFRSIRVGPFEGPPIRLTVPIEG